MPGKYSNVLKDAPKAPVDSNWQQEINAKKLEILSVGPLSSTELARLYCAARDKKDMLEAEIKKLNTGLEAMSQLMIGQMEQDGMDLFRLPEGDSLSIKDEPYSSVENKSQFLGWIHQTDQDDLLSVNYQTMNAMVKDRLINGGQIPPGVKVFIKQSITRRKSRA